MNTQPAVEIETDELYARFGRLIKELGTDLLAFETTIAPLTELADQGPVVVDDPIREITDDIMLLVINPLKRIREQKHSHDLDLRETAAGSEPVAAILDIAALLSNPVMMAFIRAVMARVTLLLNDVLNDEQDIDEQILVAATYIDTRTALLDQSRASELKAEIFDETIKPPRECEWIKQTVCPADCKGPAYCPQSSYI